MLEAPDAPPLPASPCCVFFIPLVDRSVAQNAAVCEVQLIDGLWPSLPLLNKVFLPTLLVTRQVPRKPCQFTMLARMSAWESISGWCRGRLPQRARCYALGRMTYSTLASCHAVRSSGASSFWLCSSSSRDLRRRARTSSVASSVWRAPGGHRLRQVLHSFSASRRFT